MKLPTTLSLIAIAATIAMYFSSVNQRKVDYFQQADRLIQLAEVIQHQKLAIELERTIEDENIQDLKIKHFYKASGGGSLGPGKASQRALLIFELTRAVSEEEYRKLSSNIGGPVISDGGNLRGATGHWETSLKVIPYGQIDHSNSVFKVEYSFTCIVP